MSNIILGLGMAVAFCMGWLGKGKHEQLKGDEQHDELQED